MPLPSQPPLFTRAFYIGQGDLLPPLVVVLTDAVYNPLDLSSFAGVSFRMRSSRRVLIANGACTVLAPSAPAGDPNRGKVQYDWQAGDTDIAGEFFGTFKASTVDGRTMTIPNTDEQDSFLTVHIKAAL